MQLAQNIIETTNKAINKNQITIQYIIYESLNYQQKAIENNIQQPLNLQNLIQHRNNPQSIQNISVTPTLLQNQIHQININNILIIDTSQDITSNVSGIFQKYMIVRGYQYPYNFNKIDTTEILYNTEYILKQIQYQFSLGNGNYKPGYIGQILLSKFLYYYPNMKQKIYNILKAYFQFSSKTNCPIFINLADKYKVYGKNYQGDRQLFEQFELIYKFIFQIIQLSKQYSNVNLVLINPPIFIQYCFEKEIYLVKNIFSQYLINIRKNKCTIGFQMLRYTDQSLLMIISQEINNYPDKTFLVGGVKYKTDLKNYAGQGIFFNNVMKTIQNILSFKNISNWRQNLIKVSRQNLLNLINWKIKIKQIKQIKYWNCTNCNKQLQQSIESFRKFNKQFCSIKCLKSYKF